MKVVIQCAATKHHHAGHLRCRDGRKVMFVADPDGAPESASCVYARPDDISDTGISWRDQLLRYNREPGDNPLGLLPAWELYGNPAYGELSRKYGTGNLYILSAGWGLISASFLTPQYDITFSGSADRYKRRRAGDSYKDFAMLPADTDEPVVFFLGKSYIDLACALTENIRGPRHLFYNLKAQPHAPGCHLRKYETKARTNWHYECARAFMEGAISLEP